MNLDDLMLDIQDLVLNSRNCLDGVSYEVLCKRAAKFCFDEGRNQEGIFFLSEAHAASIRVETLHQYELCEANHDIKKTVFSPNLSSKYLEFDGEFFQAKFEGLCRRLNELPKEWTLVQLTRSDSPSELWNSRPAGSIPQIGDLHITRFTCGDNCEPCHILLPEPPVSDQNGTTSILQMLYNITLDRSLHLGTESVAKIKCKRLQNSFLLKTLVRDIQSHWIKEWSCLFLGRLQDEKLERIIDARLEQSFDQVKIEYTARDKHLVRQIAYGCAHLSEENIEKAISKVIVDPYSQKLLVQCIDEIKKDNLLLVTTRRHPVILIVDEKLQTVPWEVCPMLRSQPVSRLPSIHFAHAMFKLHEKTIVNGNKILSTPISGCFIINPDLTLQNTEKRIIQFLKMRSSPWEGIVGQTPQSSEFQGVLVNNDLLLYCGHGNGTQYLNSYSIQELKVKAIPFLFGCSSVQYSDVGGRSSFRSLSNSYLMAACPCILGMLWNVTSTDTDYMALTLLNHWLPGLPINLKKVEGFGSNKYESGDSTLRETELLRVLKVARDSASMFTNGAAMVVYGIPVKLEN